MTDAPIEHAWKEKNKKDIILYVYTYENDRK